MKKIFFLTLIFSLLISNSFARGKSDSKKSESGSVEKNQNGSGFSSLSIEQKYPSALWIAATGSGNSEESAKSQAKMALCQTLGESVTGNQKVLTSADSYGKDFATVDTEIQESILFEKIHGIELKDVSKNDDGSYSALAVLNRQSASRYYQSEISRLDSEISSALEDSKKTEGTFAGLKAAGRAKSKAIENEYNLRILSALNSSLGKMVNLSYGSLLAVEQKYSEAASKIQIGLIVDGDENDRIASAFSSTFTRFGMKVLPQKSPVYNLKASLSLEDAGKLDGQHEFVRYNLIASLVDSSNNGAVILPYSLSGREGHVSASQAKLRVFTKIEKKVQGEFAEKLEDSF